MAQFRQSGTDRSSTHRISSAVSDDHAAARIPFKQSRIRPHRRASSRLPAVILSLTLLAAIAILVLLSSRLLSSDEEIGSDSDENEPKSRFRLSGTRLPKVLKFGKGSGAAGRDSRYWDRDDRRRDNEFQEDDMPDEKDKVLEKKEKTKEEGVDEKKSGGGGLYNEGGRAELDSYKEEYEKSLKDGGRQESESVNEDDEYDDGIDVDDDADEGVGDGNVQKIQKDLVGKKGEKSSAESRKVSSGLRKQKSIGGGGGNEKTIEVDKRLAASGSKKKPRRPSCEMKFLNSTKLVEPIQTKKFARFSLQYKYVETRPVEAKDWEPRFAGHQSIEEREQSYYAQDQTINCGFVKGPVGSPSTGFDMAEDDVRYMSSCHIAVASCIFGNSDRLRIPYGKTITRESKKYVCFVMFVDENTLKTLMQEGQQRDSSGFVGLWKIVVVKNLPYTDMRRVGKVPKFLAHRLFPAARYSIWLDSKLRLQRDPLQILEYFLWRKGHEYAISNHYDRHCVWEEVEQNKKLNKFNHSIIDQQFHFYQADGLKRFDPSDPNRLLPSCMTPSESYSVTDTQWITNHQFIPLTISSFTDVPEGSFIVRAHTPMSNLFSCLWFNEVDRFTPRDQLSFAYTYLKLRRMNPGKPFHLNMFKDCERRSIAKLFHHRAEEKRVHPTQSTR